MEHFLQKQRGIEVADVVVRFAKADRDALLSPACDYPVAYLTMSISNEGLSPRFYEEFEELMLQHQGRPHWGKMHFLDHEKVLHLYGENLKKFISVKERLDPQEVFSNAFIDQICDPHYAKKDSCMQNQNTHIRPMRADDIDSLVTHFCFPWATPDATNALWQKYYQEQQENIRTVGVIEKEKKIVGYGSLLRRSEYPHFANIPEINAIWIDEHHRRSGLGKQLIAYLEDLARKEGYDQVGIGVGLYEDYGPAQRLYSQLGYIPDGHGITYKCQPVVAGEKYPVDDDLIFWLVKSL